MKKEYRLPDGAQTASFKKYLRGWDVIASPIEREYGLRLICCDPGFRFIAKDGKGDTVTIPTWLAIRMADKVRSEGKHAVQNLYKNQRRHA